MACLDECKAEELVEVLGFLLPLFKLITIAVPVILVIFIMIDIVKTLISGEVDTKKIRKSIVARITAAIVVFLVPILVNFVLINLPIPTSDFIKCYRCISSNKKAEDIPIEKPEEGTEINPPIKPVQPY